LFCLVWSLYSVDATGHSLQCDSETCETEEPSETCSDQNADCSYWASRGECEYNPEYMLESCPISCNICGMDPDWVQELLDHRLKVQNVGGDERLLETEYGMSQFVNDEMEERSSELFYKMRKYMTSIETDPKFDSVRDICKNKSRECAKWVLEGECEKNPLFLSLNCAPFCETCLEMDVRHRCPPPSESLLSSNVLKSGGLDRLFENILSKSGWWESKVLSRPNSTDQNEINGPWVVIFDNFLTNEECERLIHAGMKKGYELSTSLRHGIENQKVVSDLRTSTNTWCDEECLNDTQDILEKIQLITGIPHDNAEHLQLLRYEPGQQCFVHNDFLVDHKDRPQGIRILTLYFYLSNVEEGGQTHFPEIGVSVEPKKGRAVLWPSVLNEDPDKQDPQTSHGSHPIISGTKYGANAFIHQRNAKVGYTKACF